MGEQCKEIYGSYSRRGREGLVRFSNFGEVAEAMQDGSLSRQQPSEANGLPVRQLKNCYSEFFTALIEALDGQGVRFCILRNYEGFPEVNTGSDIDLLISKAQLPQAIGAIQGMQGVRVVGYLDRPAVAMVYLMVNPIGDLKSMPAGGQVRAMEVDFDLSLEWKGFCFLKTEAVLESAMVRKAGNVSFRTPTPIDEAIVSLLASLVVAGRVKERYFPRVQEIFAGHEAEAMGTLQQYFGRKAAARLVDAVKGGERETVRRCTWPLRRALAGRSLLRAPVRGAAAFVRHHLREAAIRISSSTRETICLLGAGQEGSTALAGELVALLQSTAAVVGRSLQDVVTKPNRKTTERHRWHPSCGAWGRSGRTDSRGEEISRFGLTGTHCRISRSTRRVMGTGGRGGLQGAWAPWCRAPIFGFCWKSRA